jgi:hypothetical protein
MQVRRRTGNRLGKAFWLSDAGSERFVRFEGPDPGGPSIFFCHGGLDLPRHVA